MHSTKNNILLIELNEFNRDLLVSLAQTHNLKNLKALCSLPETIMLTEDTLTSERLEPWVQWVSIHTGTKSVDHGIRHLGDVPDLKRPQIWNRLSDRGITSGAWGIMNATRGAAKNCLFFVPDPWTFSEPEYPSSLDGVVALPRYLAKNRVRFSILEALGCFLKTVRHIPANAWLQSIGLLPLFVRTLIAFRFSYSAFYTIYEYCTLHSFIRLSKSHHPRFLILFLNAIAHVQHYYWIGKPESNQKLITTFEIIDKMLGLLKRELGPTYRFVLTNGLSQVCTQDDKPFILYRLKDVAQFFQWLGLRPTRVEPLMTYDATVFFESQTERDQAYEILMQIKVTGQNLFKAEKSAQEVRRLFFRLDFSDPVDPGTTVETPNQKDFVFRNQLVKIVRQTGKHDPRGSVFAENLKLPTEIQNHELGHFIENAL